MMRHALLALLLFATTAASAGDWTYIGKKDGVSTWTQEIEGTRLLGFRGEAVVDLAPATLLRTMLDAKNARDWVDLLSEHKVLETRGDDEVIYQRYAMAWPVADRDMVIKRSVRYLPETRTTAVYIESVQHPDAPEVAGVVRADVMRTWFAFTELDQGGTRVEVEAFTDPKGIVPQWLVNLVQKNWARNSINALAGLASRRPEKKPTDE